MVFDNDENLDGDFDEDFEEGSSELIRAKWSFDGAKTLSEAAKMLQDYADYLLALEKDGWQLVHSIEDDYGFITNPDKTKRLSQNL